MPTDVAALFETHRARVYRWARAMCGRHDDALDVVQEVFLRMLKRPPELPTKQPPAHKTKRPPGPPATRSSGRQTREPPGQRTRETPGRGVQSSGIPQTYQYRTCDLFVLTRGVALKAEAFARSIPEEVLTCAVWLV